MNLDELKQAFVARYPGAGEPFVCRVPGRVNLMGEHLDYNGLPVLPMAIDRAIYLAFAPNRDGEFRLANQNPAYPDVSFENSADIAPSPGGAWENYAKAAVQGLNQSLSVEEYPGLDVLLDSDLPDSAGLSSSSALVVGFGMAYLAALGFTLGEDIPRLKLAGILAGAEHYVGTAGGGMDQTAILMGEAGSAIRINFIPFQVDPVPLPDGVAVIVCDSLVKATKTGDAQQRYNAGPASCSLIAALINAHLQAEFGNEFEIECLGELWYGSLCFNRTEVKQLLDTVLPEARIAPDKIARRLNMPVAQVREYWLDSMPDEPEGLPLQARARHVFNEYYRVMEGRDALLAGDVTTFGRFMNASQQSCADDYGISTPELDALCAALRDAGCLGARLTGAGFGGAVVALAPAKEVDRVLREIKESYYRKVVKWEGAIPAFCTTAGAAARYNS